MLVTIKVDCIDCAQLNYYVLDYLYCPSCFFINKCRILSFQTFYPLYNEASPVLNPRHFRGDYQINHSGCHILEWEKCLEVSVMILQRG